MPNAFCVIRRVLLQSAKSSSSSKQFYSCKYILVTLPINRNIIARHKVIVDVLKMGQDSPLSRLSLTHFNRIKTIKTINFNLTRTPSCRHYVQCWITESYVQSRDLNYAAPLAEDLELSNSACGY